MLAASSLKRTSQTYHLDAARGLACSFSLRSIGVLAVPAAPLMPQADEPGATVDVSRETSLAVFCSILAMILIVLGKNFTQALRHYFEGEINDYRR